MELSKRIYSYEITIPEDNIVADTLDLCVIVSNFDKGEEFSEIELTHSDN